jgi:PAS domain-containing protein
MVPPPPPAAQAEQAAGFLLARVRAARGRLWDEGARPGSPEAAPAGAGALALFATRRVRGVSPVVAGALLAWARGERPVDLLFEVLPAREILRRQAAGRRCVALLDDRAARAHGDPRHPDGLSFALHDLCHLEKFVAPAHHQGQVGFFRAVEQALLSAPIAALESTLDATWIADRDYVIADMNGSAVFLFSVLKMRLAVAVRRRRARESGCPPPTTGGLDAADQQALRPVLATWFAAMGLPDNLRAEAVAVSARRDQPAHARRLLDYFEARGPNPPG